MNNTTPGVVVPEQVIKRLDGAPKGKRRDEGLRICVEQIEQLKEMPGILGIDIMDLDPPATSKSSKPPTSPNDRSPQSE